MKKLLCAVILPLCLLLAACGQLNYSEINESSSEPSVSVEDLPEEPAKSEVVSQLENSSGGNIEAIISNNFPMLDSVSGEDGTANIYGTKLFKREELVSLMTELFPPEEVSKVEDNQQILIYPDHFVTFKPSEENGDVLLIEVASDAFVRNNYSPNYLNSFFTFLILNRMLDSANWGQRRMEQCRNSNCYGGYTTQNRGGLNTNRGMSTFRGGGPGSGK
ncbi:DUF4247 domain-containing protein [Sediminibacillus massiliensis]|uniref:DUF4247 domain-containing protein n=1 Tax=Sediminibacillus massiliensis TaxID=1926277 RepID=UPI0009884C5F|nr:DUF4247 domain-containing protein [Sediminibacillus massiliensis]